MAQKKEPIEMTALSEKLTTANQFIFSAGGTTALIMILLNHYAVDFTVDEVIIIAATVGAFINNLLIVLKHILAKKGLI